MLEIEFNLEQPQTTWNARIHQLNGDILRRHILPKLQAASIFIDFTYCENSCEGAIISESGLILGNFTVR